MTRPNRSILIRLTAAKSVASTGLRWVPAFLPTLERALGASTGQLTAVMGFSEVAGLSTVVVGPHLDRGRERFVLVTSLGAISLSSLIALGGSLTSFAVAFVLLVIGAANFTVASHAWISKRVDYRWRARSIGTFETAWALALLVGGPLTALLINQYGWRGPFVFVGVAAAVAAVVLAVSLPATDHEHFDEQAAGASTGRVRITTHAWLVVAGSATLSTAGLSIFVISGTWLDEAFGVSTSGLGAIVMGFGIFELISSAGSAAFADRIGKMRSTLAAEVVLIVGLLVMVSAGSSLVVGVVGLLVLLLGFEYAIVTSFSLLSESLPEARGRILAVGQATGTCTRGLGVVASGWLFDRYGINGTATLAGTAAAVSLVCFSLSRRTGALSKPVLDSA